jgi:hypothetical protein
MHSITDARTLLSMLHGHTNANARTHARTRTHMRTIRHARTHMLSTDHAAASRGSASVGSKPRGCAVAIAGFEACIMHVLTAVDKGWRT